MHIFFHITMVFKSYSINEFRIVFIIFFLKNNKDLNIYECYKHQIMISLKIFYKNIMINYQLTYIYLVPII